MIYKVCQRAEWLGAKACGLYSGSGDDQRDGFVHFSTAAQLAGTLAKHFAGQRDLVLVGVDENRLGSNLKWEPSGGAPSRGVPSGGHSSKTGGSADSVLYPHLYSDLDVSIVEWTRSIVDDENGGHIVPDGLF